jgi:NAD-dependent DNA ligase
MTDSEYDALFASVSKEFPDHPALKQIGAPVITKNKVTLPYFMGSMDKIKPDTNELFSWKKTYTGPYVVSCKLDGVSGLYTTEYGTPKLYTRGDGKVGQDISYLIPYLRLPKIPNITIRGEIIMTKASFEEKYKTHQSNPRNMVAGIVNQKKINRDVLKDVEFVAYELINPSSKKPSEQMNILKTMDIKVVQHAVFESSYTTNEKLSEVLIECRKTSPYYIDGIIVANDTTYTERKEGNPEHAFAFKMVLTEQIAEARVVDVVWTPSKDGYLKPRVQIEPVQLGGVCIEYATGFNGAFIQKNGIGFGAVIELVRSGDVIPHIRKIVVPASQPKMPDVPYKWNETNVDLIIENMDTDLTVREKNITRFFKGLQVDGIGPGNVNRMIHSGFDTIPKIVNLTEEDLLKVEGFQTNTAQKLFYNIKTQLHSATLVTVMAASNLFGRGFNEKKMELILNEYPEIVTDDSLNQEQKIGKVKGIKGMSEKTAESFVRMLPEFKEFIKNIGMEDKLCISTNLKKSDEEEDNKDKSNHPLFNKSVVFTGFRDQQLENKLKSLGTKITTSVSKNTFAVLVKDKTQQNENSVKILDAKKYNIPIMTANEVINKYFMKHI